MEIRTRALTLACVTLAAASLVVGTASAAPGDLDPTFGGDGMIEIDGPPPSHPLNTGRLALAPNLGLWAVATDWHYESDGETTAVITRVRADGTLDPSFGTDGQLEWVYDDRGEQPITRPMEVVALASGGVQVSGWFSRGGAGDRHKAFVARFTKRGELGQTFGQHGVVVTNRHADYTPPLVAVRSDGSFVTCDHARKYLNVHGFLSDGSVDSAFGLDGVAQFHYRLPGTAHVQGCLSGGDGSVFALVYTASTIRVTKVTRSGDNDTTYGHTGIARIRIEWDSYFRPTIAPDDRILVGGRRGELPAVLAIGPDGGRDRSFGIQGVATVDLPALAGSSVATPAVAPDGSILLVGGADPAFSAPYVVRLHPSGELDESFGDGGVTVGWADQTLATDVVVDGSGRPVVVGSSAVDDNLVLARFQP